MIDEAPTPICVQLLTGFGEYGRLVLL